MSAVYNLSFFPFETFRERLGKRVVFSLLLLYWCIILAAKGLPVAETGRGIRKRD
jgi:hypothetical protein